MALQFLVRHKSNSNTVISTESKTAISIIKGYDLSFRIIIDSIHFCLKYLYGNDVKIIIQWIP